MQAGVVGTPPLVVMGQTEETEKGTKEKVSEQTVIGKCLADG